ncbi:hypothetical protein [Priestia megaterium]|uniref:hypothetical protein n=1 Tax=Priestia megaterium TaxID=1404 RepID=UPI003008F70C
MGSNHLFGGGQEINTGEAGLPEWFRALQQKFSNWKVYLSNQITDNEYLQDQSLESITSGLNYEIDKDLHLAVSVRSFRSEKSKGIVCLGLSCNSLEYVVRINLCFSSYITAPTVI